MLLLDIYHRRNIVMVLLMNDLLGLFKAMIMEIMVDLIAYSLR